MGFKLSRDLLRSASRIALAAGTAVLLTGCSSAGLFGSSQATTEAKANVAAFESNDPENQDYVAAAAYWGAKYEANRNDTAAGLSFARNLRLMGGARQALAVLKDVVMKAPDDAAVSSEYGKTLTATGRAQDALPFLARATQMDSSDWSTFSAYGVALDQTGNHETARRNYDIALKLSPSNPVIETNIAMSYVLTGQLSQAETTLRRLVARPDATPQMRQNLAMIASLKGNAVEAEQLAREDLTADQAKNNLTVLRQLDADNAKVATPAPEASLPAPEAKTAVIEEPAPAAIETAPVVTATMEAPAAPAKAETATRFQMTPIADDAVAPTPITPKPVQKTDSTQPAAKPVAQDKTATQPAQKQSSMLRKSYGTQAPISVANVAD